jgi:hypothetical protein
VTAHETTIIAEKIGDNFLPLRRFRRDPLVRALLDGERVEIVVRQIRGTHATDNLRKRYFATLRELWDQIPEEIEARYPLVPGALPVGRAPAQGRAVLGRLRGQEGGRRSERLRGPQDRSDRGVV